MKLKTKLNLFLPIFTAFISCSIFLFSEEFDRFEYTSDFSKGNDEWQGEFSDYPIESEAFFELEWGWKTLPVCCTRDSKSFTHGLYLSGNNHSDDLFMFIKRKIANLEPNTTYALTFFVTIFNDIPEGQAGIGGSPGECVYFKIGGADIEPQKIILGDAYILNVDKGNQSQGGSHALSIGDLANPAVDINDPKFTFKEFNNLKTPLVVTTNSKGELWLFVGTDSGFEGTTYYYITSVNVLLNPTVS